ncbi:hypothetical protein [Actinomadura litoris]|uniref:hypothetical protein n=1 Tax=Actinomadura litoris TaxID=2678616 RepID=UPI001FA77A1B|nr:hypothetical protein [Actinomadura litoris]
MDEAHYSRVEELRDQHDKVRAELFSAIRDAFPETHGQSAKRGVLAEVARRARWSREYIAQIRDGKVTE